MQRISAHCEDQTGGCSPTGNLAAIFWCDSLPSVAPWACFPTHKKRFFSASSGSGSSAVMAAANSIQACSALLATPTYSSINFMAWEYWTDGYADGSLAPGGDGLRRCICDRCFLLANAQHVKTIRTPKPPASDGWASRKDYWWSRLMGREPHNWRTGAFALCRREAGFPQCARTRDVQLLIALAGLTIFSLQGAIVRSGPQTAAPPGLRRSAQQISNCPRLSCSKK